jgi:hypothetical protein
MPAVKAALLALRHHAKPLNQPGLNGTSPYRPLSVGRSRSAGWVFGSVQPCSHGRQNIQDIL